MAEYNNRDRSKLFRSGLVDTLDIKDGAVTLDKLAADVVLEYANKDYVDTAITNLVGSAPGVLDTLNEIAAAIGDDANFAVTVTNSIATKLAISDFDSTFDTRLNTKNTDDLTEGSTNLYYTDARVQGAITVDATLSKTDGQISMPASGVTAGSYGSASAVPVFTVDEQGRITSASTTAVAGVSGFSYTSATNTYTITTSAGTTYDASGDLNSFDTDDLTEGSNLYYTEARVDANIAGKTTDDIAEGSSNLYYTEARVDSNIASKTTDDLTEGSNLYYTDARARSSISAVGSLSYNSATGEISFTQGDTDTVSEGSANLYYTDARARASISATGSINYDSGTGVISFTAPTASETLTAIKTVDGTGSGLDADLLDGQHGSYYLDWTNVTNKPDPVVTVTLTGDVTGTANTTLTDLASGTVTVTTTIAANSVALGTDTTGNYMVNVTGGTGVSVSHTQGEGSTATVSIGQAVETTSDVEFNTVTTKYIDLSTTNGSPSHNEGRMFYDNVNKSLAVYNDESDITLQVGQESWVRVYNSTGASIPNGSVVSFYGSTAGTPLVILSDASDYNKIRWVAGFATHDIEDESYGYITTFGKVNGLDTSGYSIGSSVYVSATTPGGLTTTPPTYPNYAVLVGGVVAVSSSEGSIFVAIQNSVFPTLQVNADARIDGGLVVAGDLTVLGGTSTVTTSNLAVADNMIYMNQGVEANISNAVGDGTYVTYTTVNDHNYQSGWSVSVTEIDPSPLNGYGMTITTVTANTFTVAKTATDTYVSGGVARAKSSTNPDIGFAGGYNDGTYHHTGLFRDASDGYWKFFKGYTPEPDESPYINTSDPSFSLADLEVDNLVASSATIGTVTGALSGNATSASKWQTARYISLGGDLSGGVYVDGTSDVTITATIAANSVSLGTDTTGNYVSSISNGSYITGANGGSEGASLTLSVDATSTNTASKVVARDLSGNFSAGTITASLLGNATTATTLQTARTLGVTLSGDVTGSGTASFDGSGNATISVAATVAANSVALGTDTTGNYMVNVAAGTGIGVSHTQGEGSTATISNTGVTSIVAGNAITISGATGAVTVNHADTSSVANLSSDNANGVVLQDIALTFDTYGHVTAASVTTVDLDTRFAPVTHYHDRLYNGAVGTGPTLRLNSTNELEYYNASGVIDTLYLQYSGTASQLKGPGGAQIWMDSNDGAGSGLDADLLDGNHASAFALVSHTHSYVVEGGVDYSGTYPITARTAANTIYSNAGITFNGTTDGLTVSGRIDAPIYYDSNNTGYYVDPASTTNLNNLTVNGTFNAPGVVRHYEQTTAPAGAVNGSTWWDTSNGILYKRLEGAWVQLSPAAGISIFDVNGTKVN